MLLLLLLLLLLFLLILLLLLFLPILLVGEGLHLAQLPHHDRVLQHGEAPAPAGGHPEDPRQLPVDSATDKHPEAVHARARE